MPTSKKNLEYDGRFALHFGRDRRISANELRFHAFSPVLGDFIFGVNS
jgi:hypothetical protein